MTDLFLDTLDKNRREIFSRLIRFVDVGVLGGGTAMALQIGHRRSFDFDIVTAGPLQPGLWSKIRRVFGAGCVRKMEIEGQLDFLTPNNISVTFFYDEYPLLFPAIKTNTIGLMNLKDLASNKAFVVGRRGEWRDYIDLYFLLKGKYIVISEIIEISQKRSQKEFPVRLFLEQLCYFGDIDDYTIDFIRKPVMPDVVKKYLTTEVEKFKAETWFVATS